jgi:hypothetical protein
MDSENSEDKLVNVESYEEEYTLLISHFVQKNKKRDTFNKLKTNYKNQIIENEYYKNSFMFFLIGLFGSCVYGDILGFSSLLFGTCFYKKFISQFSRLISTCFIVYNMLHLCGYVSIRIVPACDIAYIINEYVQTRHIGCYNTAFMTFALVSFTNPMLFYNLLIALKYTLTVEEWNKKLSSFIYFITSNNYKDIVDGFVNKTRNQIYKNKYLCLVLKSD